MKKRRKVTPAFFIKTRKIAKDRNIRLSKWKSCKRRRRLSKTNKKPNESQMNALRLSVYKKKQLNQNILRLRVWSKDARKLEARWINLSKASKLWGSLKRWLKSKDRRMRKRI